VSSPGNVADVDGDLELEARSKLDTAPIGVHQGRSPVHKILSVGGIDASCLMNASSAAAEKSELNWIVSEVASLMCETTNDHEAEDHALPHFPSSHPHL
jgi:hypothetical protein